MCRHFMEDYGIEVRIARYHSIYGPYGTYDGGREKAPAALCRKVLNTKLNNQNKIQVWGDGEQTRTFLFVDDLFGFSISIVYTSNKALCVVSQQENDQCTKAHLYCFSMILVASVFR